MNADDIRSALRKQYAPPNCEVVFEVPNAVSGRASRFCDAMVLHMWASRGYELEGFEIKVSRGDWKRELAMPRKADPHFLFCDRWWLITPAEDRVAMTDEIPGPWGWALVEKGGAIRIVKKAPKLDPGVRPWTFTCALIRAASKIDGKEIQRRVEAQLGERVAGFTEKVNARAQQLVGSQIAIDEADRALIGQLRDAFGPNLRFLGDGALLGALRLVAQAQRETAFLPFVEPAKKLRQAAAALEAAGEALKPLRLADDS